MRRDAILHSDSSTVDQLAALEAEIVASRRCPRLVAFREEVARVKVRRYQEWEYWGKPVPSFGDPNARLLILGLAPAAHGGNRTGRIFTGDKSGDWLYGALHAFGFASQPTSVSRDDGMVLTDCYITAAVHCAPPDNRPTPEEFDNCREFLQRELKLLTNVRAVLALGQLAFTNYLIARKSVGQPLPAPLPKFRHGGRYDLEGGPVLLASYHPSQQNTQTGRLTMGMFHAVLGMAREIVKGADSARTVC